MTYICVTMTDNDTKIVLVSKCIFLHVLDQWNAIYEKILSL